MPQVEPALPTTQPHPRDRRRVLGRLMAWTLRVGAVQMCSTDDLPANLAVVRSLTARAADEGAKLVVLPECFSFLGRREGDKLPIAETLDGTGPVLTTLRELATKHGIHIVGGGTPEV